MSSDSVTYTQPYLTTNDNQIVYPMQPYYVYTIPQQSYMPIVYTNQLNTNQFNPYTPINNDINDNNIDNTNDDTINNESKEFSRCNKIAFIGFILIVIFTATLLILKHYFNF